MDKPKQTDFKSYELIEDTIIKKGSLILIELKGEETKWFSIEETIPKAQKINEGSKMAKELLGKKVGDLVDFGDGFKILKIKKYQNPNSYIGLPKGRVVWLFQANPEKYKIFEALNDVSIWPTIHWNVKQHSNDISIGDIALIWLSGKNAGIYFIAEVKSMPAMQYEPESEKKYWVDKSDKPEKEFGVKLNIFQDLSQKPLLRENLKNLEGTKNLSIIRQPRGTNFKVTFEEWRELKELLKYPLFNKKPNL